MTELKTLKDLMVKKYGTFFDEQQIKIGELKAEAVKRINNCPCCKIYGITKIYDNNKLIEKRMKRELCYGCERDKWFNNLTEEDLK